MHVAAINQPWEYQLGATEMAMIARLVDDLGFASIEVPEHFAMPSDHIGLSGDHWLDVPTTHGFLAGATSRIRLNSMVSILPLRHPILTAKAVATLDYLSGGRAMLSVGVGWLEEEFDILRVPFHQRGRLCDEYLEAILELWHSDRPSYQGEHVSFSDIGFSPKPIQRPHPPIWIGGDSDAAISRAARFGDGWAPWQTPAEELPGRLDRIRSHPDWRDRPFDVFYFPYAMAIGDEHIALDVPEEARPPSSAQPMIDQCAWLAGLGVTETRATPPRLPSLQAYVDYLHWVAEDVMPHIGG